MERIEKGMTAKAKYGDMVTVHFTCKLDDGSILDSSEKNLPLEITIGKSVYMKGFEKAFVGMEPGEKKSLVVFADQAYGPYKEELKQVLTREQFPGDLHPEVGLQIKVKTENDEQVIRVVEVTESSITLDANHHLAGKDLFFDIKLVDIIKPGPSANAHFTLGSMIEEKGFLEEAIQHYLDAIEIDPDFVDAYFKLGVLYQITDRYDEAMSNYRKVLQLKADHMEAIINLGNVLRIKGEVDDAISYFHQALAIKPDYASTYNNLGAVFRDKGDLGNAIMHYKKALELDNTFAEAYNNLGIALQEKAQFEESEQSFRKSIQLFGNIPQAHLNLSSVLLISGKLGEGWEEYEWRLQSAGSRYHQYQYPVWDGSSLEGKTLLITAEESIDDEIMFASCLPDVIDKATLCIVECDPILITVFSRSFPKAIFIERGCQYPPDLSSVQLKTALGSLPQYYRSDLNSFPDKKHYLLPDVSRVHFWQERFQQLGQGLKIGISWQGGQHSFTRLKCSIPLKQWSQLFALPEFSFISLEYGDVNAEINMIKETLGMTIHTLTDIHPLENIDEFAAQIAALDLIISVDNATAHLAGALGKPVWMLLPCVPDWQWMLEREDSPWYPTMRLFRQFSPGDWEAVIKQVAEKLKSLI
jgi:FKBP-type peptidyl-prolyl cis-trans isomerase 2